MATSSPKIELSNWEKVQEKYADIIGPEGIDLRRQYYPPYFLRFGNNVVIDEGCRFFHPDRIILEDDARINIRGLFYGSGGLRIGRHARIGPRVFVHSANHDIDERTELAFFERGYQYRAVSIGDNVLISADVGIMPGAVIGDGSMVASGARVTAGRYSAGARLFGLPAKHRPQLQISANSSDIGGEIGIIVAKDIYPLALGIDLLIEVLGLPQVVRLESSNHLPPGIKNIILIGNPECSDHPGVKTWDIVPGSKEMVGKAAIGSIVKLPDSEVVELPTSRRQTWHMLASRNDALPTYLKAVAYWIEKRLIKRREKLTPVELREWLITLYLLDWSRAAQTKSRILSHLYARWPGAKAPATMAEPESGTGSFNDRIQDWMALTLKFDPEINDPGSNLEKKNGKFAILLDRKTALRRPMDLVWAAAMVDDEEQRDQLLSLLDDMGPHCNTGIRMTALGIAALLVGASRQVETARHYFADANHWPERGPLPLQLANQSSLVLSPLFLVWVLLEKGEDAVDDHYFTPEIDVSSLPWRGFESNAENWNDGTETVLVDETTRKITQDLLDNYIELHRSPGRLDLEFELLKENYAPMASEIEQIWLAIFKRIQHLVQRPLIRLHPWPAPYDAALSLRYDVDRPVTAGRIIDLMQIQRIQANAALGSWYFRAEDSKAEVLAPLLERYFQETGHHLETENEAIAHTGTTHHSAPTSHYWRGDYSLEELSRRQVAYAEFLATGLTTPRTFMPRVDQASENTADHGMMLIPLHFPLEAGTTESGLEYFAQLQHFYKARIRAGGHVILASHPDLDQQPLIDLLLRDNFDEVWMATVGKVVERWKLVMQPNNISIVANDDPDIIRIVAKNHICDLKVEIIFPDGVSKIHEIQLNPLIPRILE